jgi:hypothetical protein
MKIILDTKELNFGEGTKAVSQGKTAYYVTSVLDNS